MSKITSAQSHNARVGHRAPETTSYTQRPWVPPKTWAVYCRKRKGKQKDMSTKKRGRTGDLRVVRKASCK